MSPVELSHDEIQRYSRHLLLERVGIEGQQRLKAASVLCIGTGGLGSPVLLYLAAAGVGRIGLVDFDVVDVSNLQRQVVHGSSWVGRPKVLSAAERLRELNPNVRVEVHEVAFTSANALEIAADYDVLVDGTDNFPTRYLANDVCEILGKPYVYGSIFKFEGQASVFNHQGGPTYRDLFPEPPPPGAVPSCAEGGVLGILPGLIGTIQATETVKLLLGIGETLSGRLLLYDALAMRFTELRLRRDPDRPPVEELIDYQQFCGVPSLEEGADDAGDDAVGISVEDLAVRLEDGPRPFLLDVRQPHEADIASLDYDLLQPHDDVLAVLDELPRDRDIIVYCKLGARSARAARVLLAAGLERVVDLQGGLDAWAERIDPTMPRY